MRIEGMSMAKAALWGLTDIEMRKHGEQMRLETSVVHAINDEYSLSDLARFSICFVYIYLEA